MSIFGDNTLHGSETDKYSPGDAVICGQFSLSEDGDVGHIHVGGHAQDNAVTIRGIIFAADGAGGEAGTAMGWADETTIDSATPQFWDCPCATPISLSAGDYWLGAVVISKTANGSFRFMFESGANDGREDSAYGTSLVDWDASSDTEYSGVSLSVYCEYTASAGAEEASATDGATASESAPTQLTAQVTSVEGADAADVSANQLSTQDQVTDAIVGADTTLGIKSAADESVDGGLGADSVINKAIKGAAGVDAGLTAESALTGLTAQDGSLDGAVVTDEAAASTTGASIQDEAADIAEVSDAAQVGQRYASASSDGATVLDGAGVAVTTPLPDENAVASESALGQLSAPVAAADIAKTTDSALGAVGTYESASVDQVVAVETEDSRLTAQDAGIDGALGSEAASATLGVAPVAGVDAAIAGEAAASYAALPKSGLDGAVVTESASVGVLAAADCVDEALVGDDLLTRLTGVAELLDAMVASDRASQHVVGDPPARLGKLVSETLLTDVTIEEG